MNPKINELVGRVKELEAEIEAELETWRDEFRVEAFRRNSPRLRADFEP